VTQMRSFWRKARTKIRVVNTLRFPPRFLPPHCSEPS
jgi:hypothetical protein